METQIPITNLIVDQEYAIGTYRGTCSTKGTRKGYHMFETKKLTKNGRKLMKLIPPTDTDYLEKIKEVE